MNFGDGISIVKKAHKEGNQFTLFVVLALGLLLFSATKTSAEDYSSSNFIVRDPVVTIEGGSSTSTSFQYFSSSGQVSSSETTSSTFIDRAGFLYFPVASTPVLSASGGALQVSLSWTAAVGTFANVTNYELGVSTVNGGPYTFQSVGNVTSYVKTGLSAGTTYYFLVKAYAGTLYLIGSSQASATTNSAVTPPAGGGGGGGGGGGFGPPAPTPTPTPSGGATVTFTGKAYPLSSVTILKDAQVVATTVAGSDASFQINLSNLNSASYIFSVYGTDNQGVRSLPISLPITVTEGATANVTG
ncbi:MAG: hypothetical protein RL641_701, partial [Candidatus Parcubacteria bacterium]